MVVLICLLCRCLCGVRTLVPKRARSEDRNPPVSTSRRCRPLDLAAVVFACRLCLGAITGRHQSSVPGSDFNSVVLGTPALDLPAHIHFVLREFAMVSQGGFSSNFCPWSIGYLCAVDLRRHLPGRGNSGCNYAFLGVDDLPRRTGAAEARRCRPDGVLSGGFRGRGGRGRL